MSHSSMRAAEDRAETVLPVSPLAGKLINRAPFFWSGGRGCPNVGSPWDYDWGYYPHEKKNRTAPLMGYEQSQMAPCFISHIFLSLCISRTVAVSHCVAYVFLEQTVFRCTDVP